MKSQKSKIKSQKLGFTLIELLVVISIIGILSAIITANVSGIRERARDARRKSDLNEIKLALRMYHNDYDTYPIHSSSNEIVGCGTTPPQACSWGMAFERDGNTYMNILPEDPLPDAYYEYSQTDADNYWLRASIENESDADVADSKQKCNSSGENDSDYYYVCAD